MPYVAPVKDMLFVMNELAGLADLVAYPQYAEAGADVDLAPAILEEAAKFNQDDLKRRSNNLLLQVGREWFIPPNLEARAYQS